MQPAVQLLEEACCYTNLQHPHFANIFTYNAPVRFTAAFTAYLNATAKHQSCVLRMFAMSGVWKPDSVLCSDPPDPEDLGVSFLNK